MLTRACFVFILPLQTILKFPFHKKMKVMNKCLETWKDKFWMKEQQQQKRRNQNKREANTNHYMN